MFRNLFKEEIKWDLGDPEENMQRFSNIPRKFLYNRDIILWTQSFKWESEGDSTQEHVFYIHKFVAAEHTKPTVVTYMAEDGLKQNLGALGNLPSCKQAINCCLKFDSKVVINVKGGGPICITASEVKRPKQKRVWEGMKTWIDEFLWARNYHGLNKEKDD